MYQLFYDFILNNFFSGALPTITWQVNFIEIASVVGCCLVVFLAILLVCSIIAFIINFCRGLWR